MPVRARRLAMVPVVGLLGACLPAFAPSIRPTQHHAGLDARTPDPMCMGCHEPELEALARLEALAPHEREHAMRAQMETGGASVVAQWMIDDPRSCASCHEPRGRG